MRGSSIMATIVAASLVLGLVTVAVSRAQTAPPDSKVLAYGKHLASECSGCHRLDGTDNGIPSITGLDLEEFKTTMKFYQSGERNNPAMVSVAQSLDEQQISALAAFYGALPKAKRAR